MYSLFSICGQLLGLFLLMSAFRERAQILASLLAKSDKLNLSAMAELVDSSAKMSIMPTFTRWVRDSIYLQFETGNLFRDDEALVHACRQASSSANVAENAGDAFVTQGFGRTIVYNILLKLPGMERLAGDLHDAIVEDLAGYFVANVGFGPYAAEVLGLRRLYKFTPGLEMNREVGAACLNKPFICCNAKVWMRL